MFLVGILLLLISAWYAPCWGWLALGGVVVCVWYRPQSWIEGYFGILVLWIGLSGWIMPFFNEHVLLPYWQALVLYGICSLLCGVGLFVIWRYGSFYIGFHGASLLSLLFIMQGSLAYLTCTQGFPFINPLIPFFTWLHLPLVTSLTPYHSYTIALNDHTYTVLYMPPCKGQTRTETTQQLYKNLLKLQNNERGDVSNRVMYIISPESLFPYGLTQNSVEWDVWASLLPKNTQWIFGGTFIKNSTEKIQAIFSLKNGPIIKRYEKKILVDWFEGIPKNFIGRFAQSCKTEQCQVFTQGTRVEESDALVLPAQPLMCVEFITQPVCNRRKGVWLFCNETWLPEWMQALWKGYCTMHAWCMRTPLIWIGHTECFMVHIPVIPDKAEL
jgi:hypothetical protein